MTMKEEQTLQTSLSLIENTFRTARSHQYIQKFELMGAAIGLIHIIYASVLQAMELPSNKVTQLVDSLNVVYWIHEQSRYYTNHAFVAHRVEMHQHSNRNQWRYVFK